MAKDTFYFSHDYNTRTDAKIKKLIKVHGFEGYGIYWAIVEDLYNNANALPTDYESIAYDLRSKSNLIESVVNDFDLFENDGEFFGSLSIQRRLEERQKKSNKAKESAIIRWNNAKAMRTHSEGNAIKERKGKERKGKDINEIKKIKLNGFKPDLNYKLDLTEIQIGGAVEYVKLIKHKTVSKDFIFRLFDVFKTKEFTGAKWYNNEGEIYTHFVNSLKYEKIEDLVVIPTKSNDDKAKKLLGIE